MGQQLFKVHLDTNDSDKKISNAEQNDLSFLFPTTLSNSIDKSNEINNDPQFLNSQTEYIKTIQNYLFELTKCNHWENINNEINEILMNEIFSFITEQNKKIIEEIQNHLTYKQELETSLIQKLKYDKYMNESIFTQSYINTSSENNDNQEEKLKYQSEQLSYLSTQSLISVLLILIKSAEKNDSTIIPQILTLADQVCEHLPIKCLSSTNNFVFKSLEILTNYIHELSLIKDSIVSKQATKILLHFSIAKGSFSDILSLLNRLIFNTNDIYNVKNLFIHMNNNLTEIINFNNTISNEMTEFISLNYLKSINLYPNIELNEDLFTGEFISSIILSYIDIENDINLLTKQLKLSSFSCELHTNTFKYLFNIIEQLSLTILNNTTIHILIICLKLFRTHLNILYNIKSSDQIDLITYINNDELNKWSKIFLKLISNENFQQQINICEEASKTFISLINIQISTFEEKLYFISQYIIENKYLILIKEFLNELNQNKILSNWIDILSNENKKFLTLDILYSFIDIYFNNEQNYIENILISFQQILLSKFIDQCQKKINTDILSSLIIQYITYIFKHSIKKIPIMNNLFNSILIGLCLMIKVDEIFSYESIEPIFLSILPLLAEYNVNNEFIYILIGKISHVLIIGSPQDSLEIKYHNKLNLPIFTGGCIIDKNDYLLNSNLAIYSQFKLDNEIEDDKDFLMSVYNNINEGAKLISKLKIYLKNKQNFIQKSIEQQSNDACASIFAVYLKYYRRINLAKSELLRTDNNKPYEQLLSIYEYANKIQTIFSTIKGQGGDCEEFSKKIKIKTLFLLLSIKENNLIPIIKEDNFDNNQSKKRIKFQQQRSKWSKAKETIKLLQNLFHICIKFKKLMLERKQFNQQKYDYETLLHQALENFIYEDFSKTSITIEDIQLEIDEIQKCLYRQYQRASIRLITFKFLHKFIQNIIKINDNQQSIIILLIILPYLKKNNFEWYYTDNIKSSNNQLKEQIRENYYSIIKLISFSSLQSELLTKTMFYLLNLSYESIDIYHLYDNQFIEKLFINFVKNSEKNISLDLKLIAFIWFRFFILKLCENIEIDKLQGLFNKTLEKYENFIFNTLILNELKDLKQKQEIFINNSEKQIENSFKNLSFNSFIQLYETNQSYIEFYINQYLIILLQCIYYNKNILSICSNMNYLNELIYIYNYNQSNITRLLIIKILHYLIPFIPEDIDDISKNLIEKFLIYILNSIGENINSDEILSELISLYRTIISINSSWKILATESILNSIKSYSNIIENNNEINKIISSLCILGGYIEPYRLGSIVKINDDSSLGLIIEINSNIDNTNILYTIQYFQTNQIQSFNIDKLQHEIENPLTNILSLSISIDFIFDLLGYFIQIDTTINKSLILLKLKRYSLSILNNILNNKNLIEIFIKKSYISSIAKFCISYSYEQPNDLHLFNKQHLEQYCLSLDKCEKLKQQLNNIETNDNIYDLNNNQIKPNQLIIDSLSISVLKYNGWKSYVSNEELKYFKQGRIGNDDISIVPMPFNATNMETIEECGNKHKFRGCLAPNCNNCQTYNPTYIAENLQLNKGKWYYCIRLLNIGSIRMGWATNGFSPSDYSGIGNDKYSWSYGGYDGLLVYEGGYYEQFNNIRWKKKDICGCGIEIDGINTKIKYWLNGKLLGTAFVHNQIISSSSTTICNLLPNGLSTTYYPAVSLIRDDNSQKLCEFIFSPEDMDGCPLPYGYKPLFLPKLIQIENSIIDYPFNAYLINDNKQDLVLNTQINSTNIILRDFINENHLETIFNIDDNHHQLILTEKSDGFFLPINYDEITSLSISFNFEILSTNDKLDDIVLFKFDSTEITWKNLNEKVQCIIIFLLKNQQIKVYINNQCQIFQYEQIKKFHLFILPNINATIKNLAIWKYALSEEHISRLFTYGLFYIDINYQQVKEYEKQVNLISFSKDQQNFSNQLLIPFNEPFTENIWKKKKKEIQYFKLNNNNNKDYSIIELFGNKTYFILDKSYKEWFEYTIIIEISIPHYPIINEKLTIILLNPKCEIYLTHEGKICMKCNEIQYESESKIILNEYFHLFIIVQDDYCQIYINNKLELNIHINENYFHIKSNRIDLFREIDLTKNTTNEDILRLSFKSIIYLNKSIIIEQLQSSISIAPPISIFIPSLIAMGYKKHWIESTVKQYKTTIITKIHSILREQKEEFIKNDLENERKRYLTIFSQINPLIDLQLLKNLINSLTFDTNEQIKDIAQHIFKYSIHFPSLNQSIDDKFQFKINTDNQWFSQFVNNLDIDHTILEWLQDKTLNIQNEDHIYQLFNLNQIEQDKNLSKSIQYSHHNISLKQFLHSRLACENGLIIIYARHIIVNIFKYWSLDQSILFPIEIFGDYTFFITLIKLFYNTNIDNKEIYLVINSILKYEIKQLLKQIDTIDINILESKAPLFYYLQKDIIIQSYQYLIKPSLFIQNFHNEIILDEQQLNLNFTFKILHLFIELINDKSIITKEQIDLIIPILFPISLINLIFQLFLLIPIHQSKIFIIHLFTNLIKASENFKLDNRMEEFFFQLLIELSSDGISLNTQVKNKFQIALINLILILLITKQKKQDMSEDDVREIIEKFPKDIQNLLTIIDTITALTDKTKQTSLPKEFFEATNDISGYIIDLNQDDFEKSNQVFNDISDQELIKFMNNDQNLLNNSFNTFIENLPTESEPNPTFYKTYLSLSNIPADCIEIRAKFIYLFNKFIANNLSLIDLSVPYGQNILTDHIQSIKHYLLSSIKHDLLNTSFEKTATSHSDDWLMIIFDTVKASTDTEKSEYTMFYQAYQQLHDNAHIVFRRPNDQLWHAQYLDMHSTDAGGPYRDSITRICSDICSTRLPLFILCPNGRTNSGLNRDCWIPNSFPPNKSISNKIKKQYRFIGQLMGIAIRKKHYLDLKFPILFWKKLLNEKITIEDIEAIDIQSFKIIDEMEKNIEQIKLINNDNDIDSFFTSIMNELRFDVVSSSGKIYELIPGGTDIPITINNFKSYCSYYRQYRLNEFNQQIDFIQQGLYSIVPCYYLNLYTPYELEEAICGKGEIDIEILKRNTSYGNNYDQDSSIIQRFWTVLSEMFNEDQKKLFLIFVWGRSTLPTRDIDFNSKFTINSYDIFEGDVDKMLPRSHTCTFSMDLPAYSTNEIMYERLNYAITCCSSIDGDGMGNDATNLEDFITDADFIQ